MITVGIVEDNDIIREGLCALIGGTPGYTCSQSYARCEEFLKAFNPGAVDVILMDIKLPGMNGIEGIKRIIQLDPEATILMLTIYEEGNMVFDALCAGASGYLVKKTPPVRLLEAIREAYEGGSPMSAHIARKVIDVFQKKNGQTTESEEGELSDREKEVLYLLSEGKNYQEIADSLCISIDTVRHHIRRIYRKLHVHTQSQAVAIAIRKGFI